MATHLPWLAQDAAQAREAVQLLSRADEHGLDPARYGAAALARQLEALANDKVAQAFAHNLDAAMLQYLADLHRGVIASGYRAGDLPDQFDPVTVLTQAFAQQTLAQAVAAAAPALPLYRRVQDSLRQYRGLAARYPDWPALPPPSARAVAPGAPYAGAAALRARLEALGDLDASADAGMDAAPVSPPLYTAALAAGVQRFQARHGLAEDGLLGPATLAALAVPPAHRAAQLALTLERLRWLPPLDAARVVAVNLPAYRLWAFVNGAPEPALEMRVIVGTAARTPTPLFIGQMRALELNPYWNIPRSIELAEILPQWERDPDYLRQHDMELVSATGQAYSDAAPDARARLRAGTLHARQRPGPRNALGQLKFVLPNPLDIYLHATPQQELFGRSRRDLSHGCIRVEHPLALAQFVLADPQRWDQPVLAAAIASGATRRLALPAVVPVVLFYATAVTDRQGRALFAADIYGLDAPLLALLHLP